MFQLDQSHESKMNRNRTFAHDLENLPLELIENVIEQLEFTHLIKLSSKAGPQLVAALVISPKWRHLFGNSSDRECWQKLYENYKDTRALCLHPRHGYDGLEDMFRRFLEHDVHDPNLTPAILQQKWVYLIILAIKRTPIQRPGILRNIDGYLEPKDQEVFRQHEETFVKYRDGLLPSKEELDVYLGLWQRALAARNKALASELRRLARLYKAYPHLLKEPSGPHSMRQNVNHIPQQFYGRASKLERAPPRLRSRWTYRTYFEEGFPALVPYDWTLHFFIACLSEGRAVIDDKYQFILDGITSHFIRDFENSQGNKTSLRITGVAAAVWSLLSDGATQMLIPSKETSYYKIQKKDATTEQFVSSGSGFVTRRNRVTVDTERDLKDMYIAPHPDIELTWLETFVEVVAILVQKYSQAAEAAQAGDHRTMVLAFRTAQQQPVTS